jgi:aquaporin Z
MIAARLRDHWPEYAIEAACLGLFLVAATAFATLIHHPAFPVRHAVPVDWMRRIVMGGAIGLTAMAIVYSPLGARSGAHLNPATTVTFLFAPWIDAPEVRYVATVPGVLGAPVAFAAEAVIAFVLMTVVLHVSGSRHARHTGVCAGLLVWTYIVVEEPLSGMSLNPARSFGPALLAGDLDVFWVYLFAPPLGMLAAAEVYVRRAGLDAVRCAKLNHHTTARCIFRCRFGAQS